MPFGRSDDKDDRPRRVKLVSTGGGNPRFNFATPEDQEEHERHRAAHPERYAEAEEARLRTRASLDKEVEPNPDDESSSQ